MAVTRKLIKVSKASLSLVIPKEVIKKYGWKEHQKIAVKDKGRGIIELRDAPTKKIKKAKK